ncbi:hypothetical protein N9954_01865 [Maribacter sp.]|nr:hypothetical protein [Maribacter sp.]
MRKSLLFLLLILFVSSCTDINNGEDMMAKIERLKIENDSLKNMVAEINDRNVFDSITIRNIPHYQNTDKINALYKTEIVFVGYNGDGSSSIILKDSIIIEKGHKVLQLDTLRMKKGGFWLERLLKFEKNSFSGTVENGK